MKKLLLFLVLQSACYKTYAQTPDAWAQMADFGGTARYDAVGFSIGTKGYIGTGTDGTVLQKDFWEWDQASNTWTQKADFPGIARCVAVGFSIDTLGYIGTGTDIGSALNDFWEYVPTINKWGQKINFSGTARYGAVGFSIGNYGYIGTGTDYPAGNLYKDFWEFDPSDVSNGYDINGHPRGKWTQKADLGGLGRLYAVGFSIGSKGYIGTGGTGSGIVKDFWEYNSATDTWMKKADFAGGVRNSAAGFSIGTKGYIGMGNDTISKKNDFWEWDQTSNMWSQKANFNGVPRHHAVSFSIGSYGYVGTGNNPTDFRDFWEWEPHYFYKISGRIYADVDQSCSISGGDLTLKNIIVNASPGTHYGYTDDNGQYEIYLRQPGNYTISQSTNNSLWYIPCLPSHNVSFSVAPDSSTGKDFLNKADHLCSKLWVDISASNQNLAINSQAQYKISYCNNGTSTSFNTYIDVAFTNCLVPQSSSLPWSSVQGNTYRFNIGNITPTQCGSFNVTASVCNETGTTQCVSAKILPDSVCVVPDSAYDRRQIELGGVCLPNDTIRFVIRNIHPQSITFHGVYLIYVNNVIVSSTPFNLAPSDSIIVLYPGNGNTIRLEIKFLTTPAHAVYPGYQLTIEECGTNPVYNQTGQLPSNDDDDNYEEDCSVLFTPFQGNSFDPNNKRVIPQGITNNHYISPNTGLEYRINFQNTGTDTARYILLRDTISSALDITTFENVTGSHPYEVNIKGTGIIEWTFPNILLPDSNVNEPASHGFVKYKIKQQPNNPYGTVIHNNAAIIFDTNVPVITDTTENIVCELPVSSFTYNITGGNTIHLTNNSTNSTVYLWLFGDGTSDTSSSPVHTYSSTAQFDVCLFASNNCESNMSCQSVSILTSVNNLNGLNPEISIFPNPTTSSSTLLFNTQLKDAEVIIYDMLGKEIVRKKLTGDRMEIERGSLESGVYFVRVREREKQWVEKIIIE